MQVNMSTDGNMRLVSVLTFETRLYSNFELGCRHLIRRENQSNKCDWNIIQVNMSTDGNWK